MPRTHLSVCFWSIVACTACGSSSHGGNPTPPVQNPGHKLVAWSGRGVAAVDASYAVFALRPFQAEVLAQVLDDTGKRLDATSGITVTWQAEPADDGAMHTTSIGKTDYWSFARELFGVAPAPDAGPTGHGMPGAANTPQPLAWNAALGGFSADALPLTPLDDTGRSRPFVRMKVVAHDAGGKAVATTSLDVAVSDEAHCASCHGSGLSSATRPFAGWVFDADRERDWRLNALRKHDQANNGNPVYDAALAQVGYDPAGLEATVVAGHRPVLCAKCHASVAVPGSGVAGVRSLTRTMHGQNHAHAFEPGTTKQLGAGTDRATCQYCHPGTESHALRGAMGHAVAPDGSRAMECQSCHGTMATLAAQDRNGVTDEPKCQSCHTGTAIQNAGLLRFTSALDATTGAQRVAPNLTFATAADAASAAVTPYSAGIGHGGLRCASCHGPAHAEFPSSRPSDERQNRALQGHDGPLGECTACHATSPNTVDGGPHGMHPVGQPWVSAHRSAARGNGARLCQGCHGTDWRGTDLSRTFGDRTLSAFGTKTFARGTRISCYACHRGPNSDDGNRNRPPVVQDASASATPNATTIPLVVSDPDSDPVTVRVLAQPVHGRVSIAGTTATYLAEPDFTGTDRFQVVASDGSVESAAATVFVERGASASSFGVGYPGTAFRVPQLTATTAPVLGTNVDLQLVTGNAFATTAVLAIGSERRNLATALGGTLLLIATSTLPVTLPAAGAHVPLALPADAAFVGSQVLVQGLVDDPGAAFGIAFTRGICLTLGR